MEWQPGWSKHLSVVCIVLVLKWIVSTRPHFIFSFTHAMHCNTVHTVLWHSAGNLVFQTRTIQKIHNEFQIFYSLSTLPSVDNSKAAYAQHNISTFSTTFLLCQHSNEWLSQIQSKLHREKIKILIIHLIDLWNDSKLNNNTIAGS